MRTCTVSARGGEEEHGRTTAVELERRLKSDALLGVMRFGVRLFSGVEAVDVGLVVLRVVEGHDLLVDVGLEGVVAVGEGREGVGHFAWLFALRVRGCGWEDR